MNSSRIYQILGVFGLFLFIIIFRLFYLQIKQKKILSGRGEKNFLKIELLTPLRGNLLDCNGILLAANKPIFDVYWQGSGQTNLNTEKLDFLKNLSPILNYNLNDEAFLHELTFSEKFCKRLLLAKNINFDQLCQISEQQGDTNSNLAVENRFERVYPHGVIASHVLGFLSRVEKIGKSGVERILQDSLYGQDGYILSIANSTGKKLQLKEFKKAIAGTDIVLTLDLNLQKLAESLFTPDQSGAFILMNPKTGAIKSLVSFPNYDPNRFSQPISMDDWNDKMAENNPLLNRATAALYPPASTFKLVTIAAGLEHGYISSNTEFNCPGYFLFHGRKYACMHKVGHGQVTPRVALAYSCNVYCFEIARRMKIDELAFYAKKFGLGQKTNFLLYEKEGLIPTTSWKIANKKEKWWPGETLSASIGQSFLMVTPLQIARMVSAICSGFLVKPRILENEPIETKTLEISKYTQHILKDGMKMAVQDGSGKILGYIKNFDIYAKTGTAQTCNLGREKSSKKQMDHGWVAAFFYYKNEEPLVLTVVIENSGSSGPALQAASKFLRYYKLLKEPINNTQTDTNSTQTILK